MRHTWVIDMEAKDGRDIPHDDFMEALADAFDFPFGAEVRRSAPRIERSWPLRCPLSGGCRGRAGRSPRVVHGAAWRFGAFTMSRRRDSTA